MSEYYSPSNGQEYLIFLEMNCEDCKKYNPEMHYDRDINDCDILHRILDQQLLSEEDFPEIYQFENNELNTSTCPATCLQKEDSNDT
jgi:hypothetical protein